MNYKIFLKILQGLLKAIFITTDEHIVEDKIKSMKIQKNIKPVDVKKYLFKCKTLFKKYAIGIVLYSIFTLLTGLSIGSLFKYIIFPLISKINFLLNSLTNYSSGLFFFLKVLLIVFLGIIIILLICSILYIAYLYFRIYFFECLLKDTKNSLK